MATVRSALASLVSIRRADDPISPLLSDAQKTVLIRSLDLELQLARLAIMRGDAGMFRRSISAATERVADQFDPMSAEVQSALGSLRDLSAAQLPEELPDISGSLTLLLQPDERRKQGMKTGFTIIVALVIGALAAHLALPDNGYALVNFRGYIIETSVPVLVLLLILAYLAVRTLIYIWQAPRRLGEAWARGRARQAGKKATQGYIALAEGRLAQGERLLTRGARHSETPLLNYLAAARAAQMQGDRQRRDAWLNMACEQEPAATDAVLLTQAELQLEDGQYAEALGSLNRVRERQPGHAQALKLLGDLHQRRKEWQPLAELLPQIRRHGNVAPEMLDEWSVAAWSNIMATLQTDRSALERLWDDVPRHLRREPRLTLARAQALIACSAVDDAELEIRRTLKDDWSEALVQLYGELGGGGPGCTPEAHRGLAQGAP